MEENSDSNYSSNVTQTANATRTLGTSSTQKYKGVVPQPNGNWGAQIYANHQRIWLGTFKSKVDAAVAYDRASIKLRSAQSLRNFTWAGNLTLQEAKFQAHYTTETVLKMLKDESYQAKFEEFQRQETEKVNNHNLANERERSGFSCMLIFQKELTPSDVGKLNRLVIPKKYAVQYFPHVPDGSEDSSKDEVNLSFYDTEKKLWKFRYCYWKSSQSYVFTRGWSQFVKEKKLKAKDNVAVHYYQNLEKPNMWFWVIDANSAVKSAAMGASLSLGLSRVSNYSIMKKEVEEFDGQMQNAGSCQTRKGETKGFKLFGVQITID